MGEEVNMVYEPVKPRYVVEHFYSSNQWQVDGGMWEVGRGFASLDDAIEYAEEQQAISPDAKFRVVDTQP